jgi:transposase
VLGLGGARRVLLAPGATDLRQGFNGLYTRVRHGLGSDPLSGDLFVFCNRRRDALKVLYWDGTGLWVCAKRLEKGTFRWPQTPEPVTVEPTELAMILGGIDLPGARRRGWWQRVNAS